MVDKSSDIDSLALIKTYGEELARIIFGPPWAEQYEESSIPRHQGVLYDGFGSLFEAGTIAEIIGYMTDINGDELAELTDNFIMAYNKAHPENIIGTLDDWERYEESHESMRDWFSD